MLWHPRVIHKVRTTNTWMGCFGAATAKPTCLGSNIWDVVARLHRKMTKNLRDRLSSHDVTHSEDDMFGRSRRVTGGSRLKEAQAYTPQFALAVVSSWRQWASNMDDSDSDFGAGLDEQDLELEQLMAQRAFTQLHVVRPGVDNWPDAEVAGVPHFIGHVWSPSQPGDSR